MSQASSALSKVVLEGLAKPPVRYDAIPALLALILVSRSDAEAASALTASLFWAPALTAGSRIVDPAVLPRLSAGQLRACARLCRMLLEPAPRPALPDVEWVVPVACEMLAGCLLRAEEGDAQPAECCQQGEGESRQRASVPWQSVACAAPTALHPDVMGQSSPCWAPYFRSPRHPVSAVRLLLALDRPRIPHLSCSGP